MQSTARPIWAHFPGTLTPAGATLIAAALSLTINLFVFVNYQQSPYADFLLWDAARYWQWALDLSRGSWLGSAVFQQSPLYPYLLAGFISVFGERLVPVYLFQCLFGAATSAFVCSITEKITGNARTGLAAGCLYALYGMQVFYTTKILSECTAAFLLVLTARLLIAERALVPAGLATGFLLLAKPHFLPAVPLLAAWYLVRKRPSGLRRALRQAGLFLVPVAAIVLSVAARNYIVGKEWVLISGNGGETFYIGNNEHASGTFSPVAGISSDIAFQNADFISKAAEATGKPPSPAGASRYWFTQGLQFITSHPGAWLRLEFSKFLNIFSENGFSNMYDLRFERTNLTPALKLPFVGLHLLLPLFFVGIVPTMRRWRAWFPVFVLLGMNLLTMLLFFYDARFMVIAMPFFIMVCAVGAEALIARAVAVKTFKTALLQPVVVAFFCGSCFTIMVMQRERRLPRQDWRMWQSIGDIHCNLGLADKAIEDYTKASELNKHNCMPAFGVCKALFKRGNPEEAARLYLSTLPTISADDRATVLRDPDLDGLRRFIGSDAAQTSR